MTKTTSFLHVLLLLVIVFVKGVAVVANNEIKVRAPVVTDNLYEESLPLLYASKLVYTFAELVEAARESKITLEIPEGFPVTNLKEFQEKSLDLESLNEEGNGLRFRDMIALIELNAEKIENIYDDDMSNDLVLKILDTVKNYQNQKSMDGGDRKGDLYLATYRSIQAKVSCVYGVVKDTYKKRIIITFRGTQSQTRDWKSNLKANLEKMKTPTLVKDKLKGKLKEYVLVHEGFYEYLFDNDKIAGEQRYDRIVDDIRPLMEEGYSVYVTGHSLGAALSQLFSFELAGEKSNSDWMPKPITCISYAAPRSGTSGYRTAVEQEETDGLLRMLRISNAEDIVPALPMWSLGIKKRTMKHVGINLRLKKKSYSIIHTTMTGTWNAVQSSIFKPVWKLLRWHSLSLHDERISSNYEDLSAIMIDDLYKDKAVVSKDFLNAKNIQHDREGNDEL